MTSECLASRLASRVMGWAVGPERYLLGGRQWIPRWRFQPAEKLQDAYRLLQAAKPDHFMVQGSERDSFHVQVHIGTEVGEAWDRSQARAIAHAVARAVGIEV
jgi:hypothetical protein